MDLSQRFITGWSVLQDVHDLGETSRIFEPDWDPTSVFTLFSEWEEISYLSHLQIIFSETPYFGRELRYFNHGPWWYKKEFNAPDKAGPYARVCFEAVDYYCKVWVNGKYVGEHEGYSAPFAFEIGGLLRRGEKNWLVVKVSSPWDYEVLKGEEHRRLHRRLCGMFKGAYEHDDTFVARDVNPVGIWGGVSLIYHQGVYVCEKMKITPLLNDDLSRADIGVNIAIHAEVPRKAMVRVSLLHPETNARIYQNSIALILAEGANQFNTSFTLDNPLLWEMWERGKSFLYTLKLELCDNEEELISLRERFGIRKTELLRTNEMIRFRLNNQDVFVRGTSYFPDAYISKMNRERYYRDVKNAIDAGFNFIRIHVHVAKQDFYNVCDELGMLVAQDSDFNWAHPADPEFIGRAVGVFSDMVNSLYNHPSIICWIVMNEPQPTPQIDYMNQILGPQLMAALLRLDKHRPYIKGSGREDDPESGDTHDYTGSLDIQENTYLDFNVQRQRLNTEFGVDAPAAVENLRSVPKLHKRLAALETSIPDLQYYQYCYIKHIIEAFRLCKYKPCGGYFQFMFIDLCPQSGYGLYDWWGVPKKGLNAALESNQPVGVFLKLDGGYAQIYVVNDLTKSFKSLVVSWSLIDSKDEIVWNGNKNLSLDADSVEKVDEQVLHLNDSEKYNAFLTLTDADGNTIAYNKYNDMTYHPPHPEGHFNRMSHELGARLYHV